MSLPSWNIGHGTSSALSPDGRQIALADGQSVAVVDLAAKKVMSRASEQAIARINGAAAPGALTDRIKSMRKVRRFAAAMAAHERLGEAYPHGDLGSLRGNRPAPQ